MNLKVYQKAPMFQTFCKRLEKSKHSIWFNLLTPYKKRLLFNSWDYVQFMLTEQNQTPSLRKFIYQARRSKKFQVPVKLMRESTLKKILE